MVQEFIASHPASPNIEGGDDAEASVETEEQPTLPGAYTLTPRGDVDDIDDLQRDLNDISEIIQKGCGCHCKCFEFIPVPKILDHVLTLEEMEKETKEAHIISKIIPIESVSRCSETSSKRKRCHLYFNSSKVCKAAFEVLFDIKKGTRKRMQSHVCERGVEPRVHGLTGRRPSNAFSHDVIKNAVQFLLNYALEEGLQQPSPLRGRPGLVPISCPSTSPSTEFTEVMLSPATNKILSMSA